MGALATLGSQGHCRAGIQTNSHDWHLLLLWWWCQWWRWRWVAMAPPFQLPSQGLRQPVKTPTDPP